MNETGQELSIEVKASLELVKVTQDAVLLQMISQATQLQQLRQFHKIETQAQYDQAIDAFDACKKLIAEWEAKRHWFVDYPTKVVDLINGFFRTVKDGMTATKTHLGKLIDARKLQDIEAANRAQVATNEAAAAQITTGEPPENGMGIVQLEPTPVQMPSNVVTSARGAKVHTRKDTVLQMKDLQEFLKACTSKSARNLWLSENAEKLVVVNLAALKQLMKENEKKVVPGIEVVEERKVI